MSKLTFPSGVNETEYLRFEANGTWTASDKEQVCTMTNSNPANAVAVLKAKMHPVNDEDRGHTIIHGADKSTVDKHIKITRDMVNQIGRIIGIGR